MSEKGLFFNDQVKKMHFLNIYDLCTACLYDMFHMKHVVMDSKVFHV